MKFLFLIVLITSCGKHEMPITKNLLDSDGDQITDDSEFQQRYIANIKAEKSIEGQLTFNAGLGTHAKKIFRFSNNLNIKKVTYDVEDGLAVNLYWDATADVPIWRFVGRGFVMGEHIGFLQNNAGAGVTGKVLYDTDGYSSGSLSFSLLIECIKQWS